MIVFLRLTFAWRIVIQQNLVNQGSKSAFFFQFSLIFTNFATSTGGQGLSFLLSCWTRNKFSCTAYIRVVYATFSCASIWFLSCAYASIQPFLLFLFAAWKSYFSVWSCRWLLTKSFLDWATTCPNINFGLSLHNGWVLLTNVYVVVKATTWCP